MPHTKIIVGSATGSSLNKSAFLFLILSFNRRATSSNLDMMTEASFCDVNLDLAWYTRLQKVLTIKTQ